MNINDQKLDILLDEIQRVLRRKSVDHSKAEEIKYIDPNNNKHKILNPNNYIVEGRRGSGKTTLLSSTFESESNTISCFVDCQDIRKKDCEIIKTEILSDLLETIENFVIDKEKKNITEYKALTKGFKGKVKLLFHKIDDNIMDNYRVSKIILNMINVLGKELEQIKLNPNKFSISVNQKKSILHRREMINKMKAHFSLEQKLVVPFRSCFSTFNSNLSSSINLQQVWSKHIKVESSKVIDSKIIITLNKSDTLDDYKKLLIPLFEVIDQRYNKKIVLLLDDFYQIYKKNHPSILQYFHDIYKNTKNDAFCFKVVSLPNSIKINYDNEVTFSIRDDFYKISIDYNLSNLDCLRTYLLDILCGLSDNNITNSDLCNLFTSDTLNYLVLSAGGIPRDFMRNFAMSVELARKLGNGLINKDNIYTVIKDFKTEKKNSIEYDSCDIKEKDVDKLLDDLNLFVQTYKTNVFLCRTDLYNKYEVILQTLVNLRYLHLIRDVVTSELSKNECKAYLIDMTFYATSRLKSGFDFRQFWITDDASRLYVLRRSKEWDFKETQFDDVLSNCK